MNIIDNLKSFFSIKKQGDELKKIRSILEAHQEAKRSSYTVRKQIAAELQQNKLREAITYSQQAPYYYYELIEMLRQVELDGHLKAVIGQRINAALSENWIVEGPNAELFQKKWFLDYMRIALESIFWGFSAVAITNEKGKIKTTKIDRSFINPEYQTFLPNPQLRGEKGLPLAMFEDCQFIKHDSDDVCLLAIAARYAIWKNFSASDWSRYSERFGMPTIVAKTDTASETELNKLGQMLANMGTNGWAIMDKRDEFTFAESSKTDAHHVYMEFIRLLNEEISKIIVGQTMTTDNGSSQSQANVHERVLDMFTISDLTFLQFVVNDDLLPFLQERKMITGEHTFKFVNLEKMAKPEEPAQEEPVQEGKSNRLKNFTKTPHVAAHEVSKSLSSDFQKAFKLAAEKIFDAGELVLSAELMQPLTELTYKKLLSAFKKTNKNYGEDPAFTSAVNDNLFVFSGFKTYDELRAIADLLLDADGIIVPFEQFLNSVQTLNATYNTAYLLAEYNHAIACAQSIVRWNKFELEKNDYDLIFDAVNDARTRPTHKALDGVVYAVDDTFWNTNTPPLDWGCRCILRQVPKGTTGNPPPAEMPIWKPMFANNPAKTGVIFPESHHYFETLEADNVRRVIEAMKK